VIAFARAAVAPPLPPGPGVVCTRIVFPIDVFLQPCSFFNYIYQDGAAIKSLVIGSGNGRFALLNELVGPSALGNPQRDLRNTVQASFPPPPPAPRPPRPPTCRPACPTP
jgi:hypothetical protein